MRTDLRVLLLEDSPIDAELMVRELRRADLEFTFERVDTEPGFVQALQEFAPHVVLSDNALPSFDAIGALSLVKHYQPEASFIVVSGTLGEELAIAMMHSGVTDYVLKQRMERLGPVVLRALREHDDRRAARLAEAATREANERFRRAFEDAAIGMALIHTNGQIFQVNRELCALLGRPESALLDITLDELTHPDDLALSGELLTPTQHGRSHRQERRLIHADGSIVWTQLTVSLLEGTANMPEYAVAQFVDITAAQVARAQLIDLALHDPLTGLPNRALVKDRLTAALARVERLGTTAAVLFIDLDRFKDVNDTLGHQAGDELLVAVGQRLQSVIRQCDTAARMGGDEFVLVCEELDSPEDATAIADRVAEALDPPFDLGGHEVTVAASVGIALATGPGHRAVDLIRDADVAMYGAKQFGGRRFEIFDASMRDRLVTRHETDVALRSALRRNEMRLHYQPLVSLDTGQLLGYEALLRWVHPTRGMLAPDQFLAVAESTGQIVEIGEWILREACAAMVDSGPYGVERVIAVNLSARQLADRSLLTAFNRVLDETGLDPKRLCVEITENTLLVASELTTSFFASVRERGVRVAVDDFGTGYASLSYLAEFRPDVLKVDKSFVSQLGVDPLSSAIVAAVINLAESQNLSVIAEGVETPEQLVMLQRMGCQQGQGYLFGKPNPAMLVGPALASAELTWADLTRTVRSE